MAFSAGDAETGDGIGARIRLIRRRRGLTQTDLARRAGIDRTALAKVETGRRSLSAVEAGRIAAALDLPLDRLLQDSRPAPTLAELRRMRAAIVHAAADHGAHRIRVFGSVARGNADAESDVDLLIDMDADRSLFDLAALQAELRAITGRDVDVVTPAGLRERIRPRVLAEAVDL